MCFSKDRLRRESLVKVLKQKIHFLQVWSKILISFGCLLEVGAIFRSLCNVDTHVYL